MACTISAKEMLKFHHRWVGKVVDKAGDQQDFVVVEFDLGSGIRGFVWEVGLISFLLLFSG